jgi:hypothetical protein
MSDRREGGDNATRVECDNDPDKGRDRGGGGIYVDFAVFDAETDTHMQLQRSGVCLGLKSTPQPPPPPAFNSESGAGSSRSGTTDNNKGTTSNSGDNTSNSGNIISGAINSHTTEPQQSLNPIFAFANYVFDRYGQRSTILTFVFLWSILFKRFE